MNAITTIRPADRFPLARPPVGRVLSAVSGLFEKLTSLSPRYAVRDGRIVTMATGRSQTVEQARRALGHYLDDALTVPNADLVDIDLIHVVHLVHAIRAAEGTDPTEPASMARAA